MTLALTHRSYAYENGGLPTNERLEFLGDSVLGIVVTETLYSQYPDWPEGQLAKLRAAVVNAGALADVARSLDLGEYLYLGRGEETTGGRDKSSILADTMEAVFGAVFLDSGIDTARAVIHLLFDPLIERAAELGAGLDWKTSLQEVAAAAGLGRAGVPRDRRRPRPRQGVLRAGGHRREWSSARGRDAPRRWPSSGPPRRRTPASCATTRPSRPTPRSASDAGAPRGRGGPVRAAAMGRGPDDRRRRGPASPGRASPCGGPGRLRRPAARAGPSPACPGGASTCGCRCRGGDAAAGQRRGRAPRHERPAADARDRGPGREAPARPDHLRRRRTRAALRRPAHLRRPGRRRPRPRRRRRRGPGPGRAHRAGPARSRVRRRRLRPSGPLEAVRDQADPARPDRRVGHREHLRGRGAVAQRHPRRPARQPPDAGRRSPACWARCATS